MMICENRTTAYYTLDATWTDWGQAWWSNAVWREWNTSTGPVTTSATATNELIWIGWNDTYTCSANDEQLVRLRLISRPAVETDEQRQAREQTAARKQVVHQRAEKWLRQHLNEAQEEQYLKAREFIVYSRDGLRRYLITEAAQVYELNQQGKRIRSFCIHSGQQLPLPDEICVKKILLEADEPAFLKIANATPLAA